MKRRLILHWHRVKKYESKNIAWCNLFHNVENQRMDQSLTYFRSVEQADLFLTREGERMHHGIYCWYPALYFVIALIISTLINYVIVKFFGESEGITTALLAALVGTVIYTVLYALLGQGLLAAFIAGIAWLLALQRNWDSIGWINKSRIIAVIIWGVTSIVGWFLPTLIGPL